MTADASWTAGYCDADDAGHLVSGERPRLRRKMIIAPQWLSFPATMLAIGMLNKLCAFAFLVLAVSPFTAPFQTCADPIPVVVGPISNEDAPGSLVSPLITTAGHLTVAVVVPARIGVSSCVPPALFTLFNPSTSHIRHVSIRLIVLRV